MQGNTVLSTDDWAILRPAVFGAAYRILGSVADAEDISHEVWLKASAADLAEVRNLRSWLVTMAARQSLNLLKSARVRRESYVGIWLPEPLLTGPDASEPVLVDETVGTALMIVMEQLSPPERVALVLHDVFALPFGEIAEVLDSTPAASRKLASRAREKVASAKQEEGATRAEIEEVLLAFRAATDEGDLERLVGLLHPDAVYVGDGGGRTTAARRPVTGPGTIARLIAHATHIRRPDAHRIVEINGSPALASFCSGSLVWLDTIEVLDGRVVAYRRIANPEKLAHLGHI